MTDPDALVLRACSAPVDADARRALADRLAEDAHPDVRRLAPLVADDAHGPALLRATWATADGLGLAPSVMVLFGVGVVVEGRERKRKETRRREIKESLARARVGLLDPPYYTPPWSGGGLPDAVAPAPVEGEPPPDLQPGELRETTVTTTGVWDPLDGSPIPGLPGDRAG